MKPLKHWAAVSALATLIAVNASAQVNLSAEGGHVGGGDPSELTEFTGLGGVKLESWYTVRQDLIKGIEMGNAGEMNLDPLTLTQFNSLSLNSLRTAKVEFDSKVIVVEGTPRPCENFHDDAGTKRIHCNIEAYAFAMSHYSPETQYKFISHEYFGTAGIEPNRYGVSDYPFSSQISDNLSQLIVKRWAVRVVKGSVVSFPVQIQKECPANINLKFHHMYKSSGAGDFTEALASKGYINTTIASNVVINLGGNPHPNSGRDMNYAGAFIQLQKDGHTIYENFADVTLPSGVSIYVYSNELSDGLRKSTFEAIDALPSCKTFRNLF